MRVSLPRAFCFISFKSNFLSGAFVNWFPFNIQFSKRFLASLISWRCYVTSASPKNQEGALHSWYFEFCSLRIKVYIKSNQSNCMQYKVNKCLYKAVLKLLAYKIVRHINHLNHLNVRTFPITRLAKHWYGMFMY